MTTTETQADPLVGVTVGQEIRTLEGWDHLDHGLVHLGRRCHQRSSDGFFCTRRDVHPAAWNHIASDGVAVLAVWPGAPHDLFAPMISDGSIRRGRYIRDFPNWNDPVFGLRVTEGADAWCGKGEDGSIAADRRRCTRAAGHPESWACVCAASGYDHEVIWIRVPTPGAGTVQPVQVLQDAPDGSPRDPADVLTAKPAVGTIAKLRDRKNLLYVIKHRTNDEVEALDLTKQELRAVPLAQMVLPSTQDLSVQELTWVAQWFAQARQQTRDIAVREYFGGRWCMEGLNQQLETLALEPYVPQLRGDLTISLRFVVDDAQSKKSGIEATVRDQLSNPLVAATLRAALPELDGVELEPDTLTVNAQNFTRR